MVGAQSYHLKLIKNPNFINRMFKRLLIALSLIVNNHLKEIPKCVIGPQLDMIIQKNDLS